MAEDVFKIFQSEFQTEDLQMSKNKKDQKFYVILKKGVL